MALAEKERLDFVNMFARVLITAWSSEEYAARLAADPRAALTDAGLALPAGSEVVIDRTDPDAGGVSVDLQVRLWERGLTTGRFEFHIPDVPPLGPGEIADGALGVQMIQTDPSVCCSCSTQNCSCTA